MLVGVSTHHNNISFHSTLIEIFKEHEKKQINKK